MARSTVERPGRHAHGLLQGSLGAAYAPEPHARPPRYEGGCLHRDYAGLLSAVSRPPSLDAGLPEGRRATPRRGHELVLRRVGPGHRPPPLYLLLAPRAVTGRAIPPAAASPTRGCGR